MLTRFKRPYTTTKHKLGIQQERFLDHMLVEGVNLSQREEYVIREVLDLKEYHDNHQYHLNKLRKKYYHIMS